MKHLIKSVKKVTAKDDPVFDTKEAMKIHKAWKATNDASTQLMVASDILKEISKVKSYGNKLESMFDKLIDLQDSLKAFLKENGELVH